MQVVWLHVWSDMARLPPVVISVACEYGFRRVRFGADRRRPLIQPVRFSIAKILQCDVAFAAGRGSGRWISTATRAWSRWPGRSWAGKWVMRKASSTSALRSHLRGRPAVAPVYLGDPLERGAGSEQGAVPGEPGRRRRRPGVRILRWLDERVEERGCGQVGDGEAVADEIAVRPELGFDAIERGKDLGVPDGRAGRADPVAEPVQRAEPGNERAEGPAGARAHPGREHLRDAPRVTREQVVDEHRSQGGAELFVEEVLERERSLACAFVYRVQRRLRLQPLQRLHDARGVGDRLAVEDEHGERGLPGCPQRPREIAEEKRAADVGDALEVERPAHLLVEVGDGEVPEDGERHDRSEGGEWLAEKRLLRWRGRSTQNAVSVRKPSESLNDLPVPPTTEDHDGQKRTQHIRRVAPELPDQP